jgi:hypothetical protein
MNETISVNWPYAAADIFIKTSLNEFVINPVFITHIQTLENWTIGVESLKE